MSDNIKVGICRCHRHYTPSSVYKTIVLKPNYCYHNNKNILTQEQLNEKNVKYIIKYNFSLGGETITVPEDCILEFDGGSISNGTVVGQDTLFINVGDVDIWGENLTREGTWREKETNLRPEIDRLDQRIDDDENTWEANISSLRDATSSEQDTREREDAAIRDEIASERQARQENDTNLSNSIRGLEEDVSDRYTKTEVNNLISRTPETNVVVVEGQQGVDPITLLPSPGAANTLYRIMSADGTSFTEYGWTGTQYVPLSVSSTGVESAPKPKSSKFVTSGGIANSLNIMELRNGSIQNLINQNSVTTGWFKVEGATIFSVETNRPNNPNCYYGYGWAVTSSENDCNNINKQVDMYEGIIDYAAQNKLGKNNTLDISSYSGVVGVCFTIMEYNAATQTINTLRITDFDGYFVKIIPHERKDIPVLLGGSQKGSICKSVFYNGTALNKINTTSVHTDFFYLPYKGVLSLSVSRPNREGCTYTYKLTLTSSYNDVNGDRDQSNDIKGYIAETDIIRINKSNDLLQYPNVVGVAVSIFEQNLTTDEIIPLRESDMLGYKINVFIEEAEKSFSSDNSSEVVCLLHNGSFQNTLNTAYVTTDIFPTLNYNKFIIKVKRPNTPGYHYEYACCGASKDNGVTIGPTGIPFYEAEDYYSKSNIFYKKDPRSVGFVITIREISDITGEVNALRKSNFVIGDVVVERSVYSIKNAFDRNLDKLPMLYNACRMRKTSDIYKDFQMLIITDSHDDKQAVENAIDMTNGFETVDALIHCGDITDHININQNVDSLWKNPISECNKPCYFVIGNHDGGEYPYISCNPSKEQLFSSFIQPIIDAGYLRIGEYVSGKCYYYHDFTVNKIRLIVLDNYESPITPDNIDETHWRKVTYNSSYDNCIWNTQYNVGSRVNVSGYTEYSFEAVSDVNTGDFHSNGEAPKYKYCRNNKWISREQALWFISTLKNTPADYGVIVASHMPFSFNASKVDCKFSQTEDFNLGWNNMYITNDFIADIVNAFQNKTSITLNCESSESEIMPSYSVSADFRTINSGVYFHSFVGGHIHRDYVFKHNIYNQYQVIPTCANTTYYAQFPGSDIRRSWQNNPAKDSITVVSYRHNNDVNSLAMVKIGINTTEDGRNRDFEVLSI